MAQAIRPGLSEPRLARSKARDYRVMFYASLPIFLAAATVKRLIPQDETYRGLPPADRRSIYRDAVAMANTFIPFAFMH